MNSPWSQETYLKAYLFAARAHAGQTVPGTALPYIIHPALVAMEVLAALAVEPHRDGDLAVRCALLHDTIEDTPVTVKELAAAFGPAVAQGVLALTRDNTIGTEPAGKEAIKRLQMADSLDRIQNQPREVAMVKMADRITNLQPPPPDWDTEKIETYHREAGLILQTLKDASGFLARRLEEKIAGYLT